MSCREHRWVETASDIVRRCSACGAARYAPSDFFTRAVTGASGTARATSSDEDMAVYYKMVAESQASRMDAWLDKGVKGLFDIMAHGENLRRLEESVRGHLEEQHFWAHPPPYVGEDSRVMEPGAVWRTHLYGDIVARCKDGAPFEPGLNASLELYRRYKYGPEERKYFRNRARRMAAKGMVEWWLA